MYKCEVCGNVSSRMYDECPKCGTKNSYLPTENSSQTDGNFKKEDWDEKVNS